MWLMRDESMEPAWFYSRILVGAGMDLTLPFSNKYGITHVINCAFDSDSPLWFRTMFPSNYIALEAYDNEVSDIREWYPMFERCLHTFLREGTGTIYVHCQAGINRSAFLTLMYVCKNFGLDMDITLRATRHQRPVMFQNRVYMNQAKEFINGRLPS
jgi:protein-tyrosine phosphatase